MVKCPLCGSIAINEQDKKYPYFCLNCETAFTESDILIAHSKGIVNYRKSIGVSWTIAKQAILKNAEKQNQNTRMNVYGWKQRGIKE